LRLVFAGTPRFAAVALEALLAAGHDIGLVLTQPDRPAGRGMLTAESDVKRTACEHGLEIAQPQSLKTPELLAALLAVRADLIVVAAYGLILPPNVLEVFRHGCVNIHASLLPRWRGAAPIQRALLAGDTHSGISIMQMDAGLDTGPIILASAIALASDETAGSLHDRLARLGGELIVIALEQTRCGALQATPQDDTLATYAPKIGRAEAAIHWSDTAVVIDRQVRAFNPVPGAHARFNGELLKIWRAVSDCGSVSRLPGSVIAVSAEGIQAACGGAGAITIRELQRAGGRRLSAGDFLRGHSIAVGSMLEDGT